jgi:hypothetical protein
MLAEGTLARLTPSRDQEEKIYVQHRMRESAPERRRGWKQALMSACGDAQRMARDVDAALHEIIQTRRQDAGTSSRICAETQKPRSDISRDALLMSITLPFTEIAGQRLDPEQTAYLEGLFAGLKNRGLTFAEIEPNPVAEKTKPNLEALIFEERVKQELHPLDAYPLLLEHAAANEAPDKENIFRFKWNGLFFLAPNKEAFMCRLRIPGGVLKTFQLREVAHIAQELTTGYVQITARQLSRLIEPKMRPKSCGASECWPAHRGAGADNIRNITANPTAGIDPHELIDVLLTASNSRKSSSTTVRSMICRASSTSPSTAAD